MTLFIEEVIYLGRYYEWQSPKDGGKKKQPYFIYFPHAASRTVEEVNKAMTEEEGATDRGNRPIKNHQQIGIEIQ